MRPLTLGIGGSGGVFAPSLFLGVTSGMALGEIAGRLFGPAADPPALYAVVAMGAVFTVAARAPLTSLASVVEMTGDFTLALPVMLAVRVPTAVSRRLSYGTSYTTKLLGRGIDIDRPKPSHDFADMIVADTMQPFPAPLPVTAEGGAGHGTPSSPASLPGPVTGRRDLQALFANESLSQALRQLDVYGRDGLPVLSPDGQHVQGWAANASVLHVVGRQIRAAEGQAPGGQRAADWTLPDPEAALREPSAPLPGYQMVEITLHDDSPAVGETLGTVTWPPGWTPVSVLRDRQLGGPRPGITLGAGDRISLLAAHPPPAP